MQPRLEIRHLQMLLAIAETGSVTAAAAKLGVTSSALSHRIREAERRLDVVLYERIKRQLRMTPAGAHLYQAAARLLAELSRAEADVQRVHGGARRIVRLCIGAYSAYHWLPAFLKVFAEVAPGVEVQVAADAARRPLVNLMEGAIDMAIMPGEVAGPGVTAHKLFTDELVAIMPAKHRLAGKAVIRAEDLAGEDYLTYDKTPEPGYEYERLMLPARIFPRWRTTVELPEAIVELVRAGFGLSILTRWAIEPHLRDGSIVCARVTDDGLPLPWSIVLRDSEHAGSPVLNLAQALQSWCDGDPGMFAAVTPKRRVRTRAQRPR